MPRTMTETENAPYAVEHLFAVGRDAPDLDAKLDMAEMLRGRGRERSRQLDRILLERIGNLTTGMKEVRDALAELREVNERLLAPPWHPATLEGVLDVAGAPRAAVVHAGTRRIVDVADEVGHDTLAVGDQVFLSGGLNLVVGKSPQGRPRYGETGVFDRCTEDGRIVLKCRDEEFIVNCAASLADTELQPGDAVLWDRGSWMAFEKLARAEGRQYLLTDIPDTTRDQVGGLEKSIDVLLGALTASLVAPDLAARYGLSRRNSCLLYGPPGCGKTLLARLVGAELGRLSGKRVRLAVVKPAAWESPWVGSTEQNIRECFRSLRTETGPDEYSILFLDEIESVGRIRGSGISQHSDRFLAALLAELDGFTDRSGIAVIAATNRKDLVDPALLERLSDVEISVKRPDMRGARSIFGIHLPAGLSYNPNGASATATRDALIDTAVARFYSPNGDNELCTIKFRDGKTRPVAARELASGRIFEQVCRAARRAAFTRDYKRGDAGLRVEDIEEAAADAFERLATTLTPENAHVYLDDLPQDVDVVSVEPVPRRLGRAHAYRNTTLQPAGNGSEGRPS